MDTGEGRFVQIKEGMEEKAKEVFPKHGGTFTVGEIIELRGSKFKVKSILYNEIRLKLLKK